MNSNPINNSAIWKPILKDCSKVSASAYKIVYEQALERFEECASESESITNKSIKVLIAIATLVSSLCGFMLAHSIYINLGGIILLVLIIGLDIILLFQLISPRNIYHRGLMPKTSFPSDLDEEIILDQESIVYHQVICILQDKTDEFYKIIDKRIIKYKTCLFLSLVILVIAFGIIGFTISHS